MTNINIEKRYYNPKIVARYTKWKNDPTTCVRVCEYPEFMNKNDNGDSKLIDPDELIINRRKIKIKFSYPLSNPTHITFQSKNGFTRKDLFRVIYEGYKRIYDEEERVDKDPGMISGMPNRATSQGPFGIWGHVMKDLFIEGVIDCGNGKYELSMGS